MNLRQIFKTSPAVGNALKVRLSFLATMVAICATPVILFAIKERRDQRTAKLLIALQDSGKCKKLVPVQSQCRRVIQANQTMICDYKLEDGQWLTGWPQEGHDVSMGRRIEVCTDDSQSDAQSSAGGTGGKEKVDVSGGDLPAKPVVVTDELQALIGRERARPKQ